MAPPASPQGARPRRRGPLSRLGPLLALALGCSDPPTPAPSPAPPDLPRWSTAPHVTWASLAAEGERAVVIDVPGGAIDRHLAEPDVATVLNDRFATIFLHPRAFPELTARLGWPSLTALDPDGCLRATTGPVATPAELIAQLNVALRARRDGHSAPLPEPADRGALPTGGGTWTADGPAAAAPLARPDGTLPRLVVDGRPYLYPDAALVLRCGA